MNNDIVSLSGLIQITFAVFLGWPVLAFRLQTKFVGPFKNAHKLLQAHIDNIMMALLQIAISAAVSEITTLASVLLVIGSWINPQLFLMAATVESGKISGKWAMKLAYFSFTTLTIAYPLILWKGLARLI